jgi:hypothetical protein
VALLASDVRIRPARAMGGLTLLVIPARRFSTAEGWSGVALQQPYGWSSSVFAFNGLQALDPSLRWDDEQNRSIFKEKHHE